MTETTSIRIKHALVSVPIRLIMLMPHPVRRIVADVTTWLAQPLLGRHRAVALANLRLAFGDSMTEAERRRMARESFRQFLLCLLDAIATIPRLTPKNWQEVVRIPDTDLARVRALSREGKGIILLFFHYGNWELMGAVIGCLGISRLSVVARFQKPWINPWIEHLRTHTGNRVFYKQGAIRRSLTALKAGEMIGIAVDQNSSQGIFVPFFGIAAGTSDTVAALARSTGAAIVPITCTPNGNGTYTGRFLPRVSAPVTDNKEADVRQITRNCQVQLETIIHERPELWMWGHRRWKSRPPDEHPPLDPYGAAPQRHSPQKDGSSVF